MKLSIVDTGLFKLDGGAMFGVVPKSMWNKLNPADENNMCTWTMRSLLIEIDDRKILIDTGLGNKQSEKFYSHFYPHGTNLHASLSELELSTADITDVFLTHLHFDHDGGAVVRDGNDLRPTFENARYWSNERHYNWAFDPNDREKASFLKENFVPLKDHKVLDFVDVQDKDVSWIDKIDVRFSYGHTEAMMSPIIHLENGKRLIYCADLMPSAYHIPMPYVMCYDIRPLETLKEKELLLNEAVEYGDILFFEHDPVNQCATVKRNEKGRIVVDQIFTLDELKLS